MLLLLAALLLAAAAARPCSGGSAMKIKSNSRDKAVVRERQAANLGGRGLVKVDDVQRTASGGLREARGRYAKLSPATAALVAGAQQARQGLFDGDSGR
eukprot:COSAG02_NODE_39444_length_417_cov_0.691824_1_plen_99_part_00